MTSTEAVGGSNRNDWPHRSVVAKHSSASGTGSFCQSSVLNAITSIETEAAREAGKWNTAVWIMHACRS